MKQDEFDSMLYASLSRGLRFVYGTRKNDGHGGVEVEIKVYLFKNYVTSFYI